jgi:hypothetical protein
MTVLRARFKFQWTGLTTEVSHGRAASSNFSSSSSLEPLRHSERTKISHVNTSRQVDDATYFRIKEGTTASCNQGQATAHG